MEKQRKKQGNTETANETAQVEVSNLMDLFDSSDSDKMQNTETTFEPVKSDSSDNHPSTLSSTEDEMPLGSQAFSLSVPKRPLPARDCHSSKQVKVSNLMDLFDNSGCDKGQNSETEESDFTGSNADYNPSSTPSSTEDEALSKHQSKKKNVRRALDKAPSSTEDEMPLGSQASSLSVPKRPLPARDLHSSKQVEVSNLMDSFDHSDPPSTQSSTEDEVLECPSEKLKKRNGTSTNAPKRHGDQESGGDDDDDVDVDDDLPCTSTTNPPAHSHKRVRTNYRRDAGDDPDIVDKNGNDMTKPKRVKKPADDDDDDDDGCDVYVDVEECDEDGDGEEQHITSTISAVKQRQKHHDDDDAPQVSRKRPWTAEERTVVLRRMGKFVALRKVPGKNDCQMCICKESPVLNKRTWKDVKYYVHNEIAKVKKKLAF
ncbi:hypothetical protein JOB18_001999 [Solea senegalensis]|uniref:Uncharacterized protein n=1 Tax=Solea senegalensis TaxID=28829 RepID=A0AAV6PR99_SOLSE|nr:dentin sialophosphoprotein-like isoform X2 [Solea senegalensis]KAG7474084.1 hypothetical protein JOB18_001999 [Solea senegalensis]